MREWSRKVFCLDNLDKITWWTWNGNVNSGKEELVNIHKNKINQDKRLQTTGNESRRREQFRKRTWQVPKYKFKKKLCKLRRLQVMIRWWCFWWGGRVWSRRWKNGAIRLPLKSVLLEGGDSLTFLEWLFPLSVRLSSPKTSASSQSAQPETFMFNSSPVILKPWQKARWVESGISQALLGLK